MRPNTRTGAVPPKMALANAWAGVCWSSTQRDQPDGALGRSFDAPAGRVRVVLYELKNTVESGRAGQSGLIGANGTPKIAVLKVCRDPHIGGIANPAYDDVRRLLDPNGSDKGACY
jgi:hypothetical protein